MTGGIFAAAGWITGVGAAAILVFSAVRSFLQWPVTEAVISAPEGAEVGFCDLRIVNNGPTKIQLLGIATLWPRQMRLGIQEHGKAEHPWELGPELPIAWETSLPASAIVPSGGEVTVSFMVRNFSASRSSQFVLIKLFSARFIARKSWKPVKTLHMATATKITA